MSANLPPEPFDQPKFGRFDLVVAQSILPCPYQARADVDLDGEDFESLKRSIDQHGLLHPIIVRRRVDGAYELIAGCRRLAAWTALGRGGMPIPVFVVDATDDEVVLLVYIENGHRKGVRWWDDAQQVGRLRDRWRSRGRKITGAELAALFAVSDPLISQYLTVCDGVTEHVRREAEVTAAQVRLLTKDALLDIARLEEAERAAALRAAVSRILEEEPGAGKKKRRRLRDHLAFEVKNHLDGSTSYRIHPEQISAAERAAAITELKALILRLRGGRGAADIQDEPAL